MTSGKTGGGVLWLTPSAFQAKPLTQRKPKVVPDANTYRYTCIHICILNIQYVCTYVPARALYIYIFI